MEYPSRSNLKCFPEFYWIQAQGVVNFFCLFRFVDNLRRKNHYLFAARMGLEPMISAVTGQHPLQLDQRAIITRTQRDKPLFLCTANKQRLPRTVVEKSFDKSERSGVLLNLLTNKDSNLKPASPFRES